MLAVHGPEICVGEWGRALGRGLYEFRIRRSLAAIMNAAGHEVPARWVKQAKTPVLLRVFCALQGDRVVILFHGYDKGADPSEKRQQREIAKARRIHEGWRRRLRN